MTRGHGGNHLFEQLTPRFCDMLIKFVPYYRLVTVILHIVCIIISSYHNYQPGAAQRTHPNFSKLPEDCIVGFQQELFFEPSLLTTDLTVDIDDVRVRLDWIRRQCLQGYNCILQIWILKHDKRKHFWGKTRDSESNQRLQLLSSQNMWAEEPWVIVAPASGMNFPKTSGHLPHSCYTFKKLLQTELYWFLQ